MSDQCAVAFFFNPAGRGSYGDHFDEVFIAALCGLESAAELTTWLRKGDLLTMQRATRIVSTKTPIERVRKGIRTREMSSEYRVDPKLFLALAVELPASATGWKTFDPFVLPYEFATHDVHIIATNPIPRSDLGDLHGKLMASSPDYLGGMEIDSGNPLQLDLIWDSLIEQDFFYRGSLALGLDPYEGFEAFPNDSVGYWWGRTALRSILWYTNKEDTSSTVVHELTIQGPVQGVSELILPQRFRRSELSERGRASAELLRDGLLQTPIERVASALSQWITRGSAQLDGLPEDFEFSGQQVPGADRAVVPKAKLYDYALLKSHPTGGPKALRFELELGIQRDDWEYLRDHLLRAIETSPVRNVRMQKDACVQYEIVSPMRGLNGNQRNILSAWNVKPGAPPSLSTVYVAGGLDSELQLDLADPISARVVVLGGDGDGYLESVHRSAGEYATDVAKHHFAKPMFVGNYAVAEGSFGWAWVVFEGSSNLGKWLAKKAGAERSSRVIRYRAPFGGGFIEREQCWAEAYAEAAGLNGFEATTESRLN